MSKTGFSHRTTIHHKINPFHRFSINSITNRLVSPPPPHSGTHPLRRNETYITISGTMMMMMVTPNDDRPKGSDKCVLDRVPFARSNIIRRMAARRFLSKKSHLELAQRWWRAALFEWVKEDPSTPCCHQQKIMAYSCCISNIDQNQISGTYWSWMQPPALIRPRPFTTCINRPAFHSSFSFSPLRFFDGHFLICRREDILWLALFVLELDFKASGDGSA